MEIEAKIAELEKEIQGLKKKRRDRWDIFQIIASLLLPASITFAGYFFASSMKKAELESSHNRDEAQRRLSEEQSNKQVEISKINARVGQANTASSLLNAMLSNEPQRRKLAIRLVLIALPDDGPDLVKIVSESDVDPGVKSYAKNSIDERRSLLVEQLFKDVPSQRISAAEELIVGWRTDKQVVELMLSYASNNLQNANGIYNTLVVLNGFDLEALRPSKAGLEKLLLDIGPNRERTKLLAEKLQSKLKEL